MVYGLWNFFCRIRNSLLSWWRKPHEVPIDDANFLAREMGALKLSNCDGQQDIASPLQNIENTAVENFREKKRRSCPALILHTSQHMLLKDQKHLDNKKLGDFVVSSSHAESNRKMKH